MGKYDALFEAETQPQGKYAALFEEEPEEPTPGPSGNFLERMREQMLAVPESGAIPETLARPEAIEEQQPFGGMMVAGQYVPPEDVPATQAILQGQQNVDFLNRNLLFPTSPEFARLAKEGRAEMQEDSPYARGGPSEEELEAQYEKAHPYIHGIGKALEGFIPQSWEQAKEMLTLPRPTDVEGQMRESEELGKAWRGEYGPSAQAASITGTALQALPLLHLPFAETPLRPKLTDLDLVGRIKAQREAQLRAAVKGPEAPTEVISEPARPAPAVEPTTEIPVDEFGKPVEQINIPESAWETLPDGQNQIYTAGGRVYYRKKPTTGGEYATQEGQVEGGVPVERPRDDTRRAPAETGGGGGVQPAATVEEAVPGGGVTPEAQAKIVDLTEDPNFPHELRGPTVALKLDDGTILYAKDVRLHSQVLHRSGVDPARVVDSGFYGELSGEFRSHTPKSVEVFPKAPEAEAAVAPLVRVKHGEHTKEGYTAIPTEETPVAPEVVIPESERGYAGLEPPVSEAVPGGLPQKPSKIGKSIEAKAVEAKLTQGFSETALYDPITIAHQSQLATDTIRASPVQARAMIRGETPLPEGLHGISLITAMEEHLLKHPNAQVAYEMANSPLVSATSTAAQELRLAQQRMPDSIAAKFTEIKAARAEGARLRGETSAKVAKEITKEVARTASKRPTWEAFVREIVC